MSRAVDIDYLGADGGALAIAFASGCMACFVFCATLGKFLWSMLGKAKDDEVSRLKATMEANERLCREREALQSARMLQLETMLWMHGPQQLRADIQGVISEQHLEMRRTIENGGLKGDKG